MNKKTACILLMLTNHTGYVFTNFPKPVQNGL